MQLRGSLLALVAAATAAPGLGGVFPYDCDLGYAE